MKKLLICILLCFCVLGATPMDTYCKTQTTTSMTKRKKKKKKDMIVVGYCYKWKTKTVTVTKREYLGVFWITHYCPCARCCGAGGGRVTASGTTPTAGRTVGVNTKQISFGTDLQIGDTKGYVAEDTGGGAGWNHLDVFCNSHSEALAAGVSYEHVWRIYQTTKKKRYRARIPIYSRRKRMSTVHIIDELNRLYKSDMNRYMSEVNYWKNQGYRVYRDNNGVHKVIEPPRFYKKSNDSEIYKTLFGGIFGDIFKGE